jgi:hypothetical protein
LADRISDFAARIAAAIPASARFFWSVEASASTRAAVLARSPISRMVAAISPDPSTVFSGAVMIGDLCSIRLFPSFYHVWTFGSSAGRQPPGSSGMRPARAALTTVHI